MTTRESDARAALARRVGRCTRAAVVGAAVGAVPRLSFLPPWAEDERLREHEHGDEAWLRVAYEDPPVLLRTEHGMPTVTCTAPALVAAMVSRLEAPTGARILDLGCGTGYSAALIARTGDRTRVDAVEFDRDAAEWAARALQDERVTVRQGDAFELELPPRAYDAIHVGFALSDVPSRWLEALRDGGRMVAPLRYGDVQALVTVERTGPGRWAVAGHKSVGFVPGKGQMADEPPGLLASDVARLAGAPVCVDIDLPPGAEERVATDGTFWLWLAQRDVRATPLGPGVLNTEGGAVFSEGSIKSYGDPAPAQALEKGLRSWLAADCPSVNRYRSRVALDDVPEPSDGRIARGGCVEVPDVGPRG